MDLVQRRGALEAGRRAQVVLVAVLGLQTGKW